MLTGMTEEDWAIVLEVFDAVQSRRASRARTTANSSRRCTTSPCAISPGAHCHPRMASGTASGSGFGGSAARGCFQALAELSPTAHLAQMFDSTVVRAHVSGGRGKRGQQEQALGRSRGGFSCKIHLKTDLAGLPIAFNLTGGEVSDSTQLEISLDIGPDIRPRAALGDKGYDSKANRAACRARGIVPVIPYRENTRNRPTFFAKVLYRARARIEQAVGKLKRFKRIALRCEKTADSYAAFVAFACGLILVKSVHRT
jgi:transposase